MTDEERLGRLGDELMEALRADVSRFAAAHKDEISPEEMHSVVCGTFVTALCVYSAAPFDGVRPADLIKLVSNLIITEIERTEGAGS